METMYFDLSDFTPSGTFKRAGDNNKLSALPPSLEVPYITGTLTAKYSHTIRDAGRRVQHVYKNGSRLAVIEE